MRSLISALGFLAALWLTGTTGAPDARAGGQRQLGARGSLFASVIYQASDYNASDPIFGATRDDEEDAAHGVPFLRLDVARI